jgi:hypothetical protein
MEIEKDILDLLSQLIWKMPKDQKNELLSSHANMDEFARKIFAQLPQAFINNATTDVQAETINSNNSLLLIF